MAFIAHASEDKTRFVDRFVRELEARGVRAWYDSQSLLPGDRIVEKVFEEGIQEADAVIIVLSTASVRKPWVREELNAAVVKRLQDDTTLIPIVIDECEVPAALRTTLHQKFLSSESFDSDMARVVSAIFGSRRTNPLGPSPTYTRSRTASPSRLSVEDAVLLLFGDLARANGDYLVISTDAVWAKARDQDIAREDFEDAIEELVDPGYLKASDELAVVPEDCSLTTIGFERYGRLAGLELEELQRRTAGLVINQRIRDHKELAERLGHDAPFVRRLLQAMSDRGLVELEEGIGGHCSVSRVRPRLKKILR